MSNRIAYWDNVKFFLMLLVVETHFFINQTQEALTLYRIIYIFHMPLFFFVSGIFTNHRSMYKRRNQAVGLVVIGIVFNILVFLLNNFFFFESTKKFYITDFNIIRSHSISWFCFSLAICIIMSYLVRDIKPWVVILISFLIGVFYSYDRLIMQDQAVAKTCSWFIIFYMGMLLSENKDVLCKMSDNYRLKISSILLFILMVAMIYITRNLSFGILNCWAAFLGNIPGVGWKEKIISYIVTVVMGVLFLLMVPTKEIKPFTKYGQRTLQVYFWHALVRTVLFYYGFHKIFDLNHVGGFIVYAFTVFIIDIVLSLDIFKYPTNILMDVFVPQEDRDEPV